jgi:hypothetical protein
VVRETKNCQEPLDQRSSNSRHGAEVYKKKKKKNITPGGHGKGLNCK